MQKLLRPCSSSAPIICTMGSPSMSLSIPFKDNKSFHNLAFSLPTNNTKYSCSLVTRSAFLSQSSSAFPIMAASAAAGSSVAASLTVKKPFTLSSAMSSRYLATLAASSSNCCICRCAIDNRTQSRAWVVLKDGRTGSRAAWLHSGSDGSFLTSSDKCVDGDNGEETKSMGSLPSEDKPLKLNRRPKGSPGSCDTPPNPDLLTIPGVGPRNLRKLVEKGIAGVAELKQLYKDKVYCF